MDADDLGLVIGLAALALLGGLYWGTRALRRLRLITDTPTSRVRSASQGYVELQGTARLMDGDPIVAPLSRMTCVWYQYAVKRKRNEKNSSGWEVVNSGSSSDLFLLDDGDGCCIVDAAGATVTPSLSFVWYGNRPTPDLGPKAGAGLLRATFCDYRYEEQMIPVRAPLYALGWFRTQRNEADPMDESVEVRELMAEWKRDPRKMKLFDANRDGLVDVKEWEAARRVALAQVRKQTLDRALDPDFHVLRRPPDGRPYLLSGVGQQSLVSRLRWQMGLSLLIAALAAAAIARLWPVLGSL